MNIHDIHGILSRISSLQHHEYIKILDMDLEILLEYGISKYIGIQQLLEV